MASVCKRKVKRTGRTEYYVQFYDHKQKNRKIYGFPKESSAMVFAERIDKLIRYRKNREEPDNKLNEWILGLPDNIYDNLVKWELTERRVRDVTLKYLTDLFLSGPLSVNYKKSSLSNTRDAVRRLLEYFGEQYPIKKITQDDADAFNLKYSQPLAPATWMRLVARIKHFFNYARLQGWVQLNPFAHLKSSSIANPAKMEFISNETISLVLEYCRNSQERLIVCLARYGGLRIPSELRYMTWADVDFKNNRLLIKSPKKESKLNEERGIFTEHARRYIPLFPELQKAFLEYYEDFPENGPELIFASGPDMPKQFRTNNTSKYNAANILKRAIKKAGVHKWPRLYHNLRSTRETELIHNGFQIKDVCTIIGNTPEVAMKHYIQVSPDLFERCSNLITNANLVGVSVGVNDQNAPSVGASVGAQIPAKPRKE